jgi:hypothetical protein
MQRGAFSFDPLLTEALFALPIKPEERPEELDTQVKFFRFYSANGFFPPKFAIENLVRELAQIANEQGIFDKEAALALEIFLSKFNYAKNTLRFNEIAFPLFTQGVTQLSEIVAIVKKDATWSDSRKTLIQHLLHRMGQCPDGVTTHISDARLALDADLRSVMMLCRRGFAANAAANILIRHDIRSELGGTLEVPDDTEIHYITALINLHHKNLGLLFDPDNLSIRCTPTEEMEQEFIAMVSEQLDAQYIVERILDDEPEYLSALLATSPLNIEAIDTFGRWLTRFGTYVARGGLPSELARLDEEDNFQLQPHLRFYVMHAVFNRLVKSGLLDPTHMNESRVESLPGARFFIPTRRNIRLAYVEHDDAKVGNMPFVLHYHQAVLQEAIDGVDRTTALDDLLQPEQRRDLQNEVVDLIRQDWPAYVATHSAKEVAAFLKYVSKKFPDQLIVLLKLMRDVYEETQRDALIERLNLKERVLLANDVKVLFAYLALFPRASWPALTRDEFQEMEILQEPFLPRAIELFVRFSHLLPSHYLSHPARLHAFIMTAHELSESFPAFSHDSRIVDLFVTPTDHEARILSEYIVKIFSHLDNELFDVFGPAPKAQGVVNALCAAKTHAARLAKGIYTLYDSSEEVKLLNQTTLRFLESHTTIADHLGSLLVVFGIGFEAEIDESLLTYLEKHLTEIELFFLICSKDPSLYEWLLFAIRSKIINVESFKRLLERPELLNEVIDTIDALHQCDPALSEANGDFLVSHAGAGRLLVSIREMVNRFKSREIALADSGLDLFLMAAMDGAVDICRLLATNGVDAGAMREVKLSVLREFGYAGEGDADTRVRVSAKELAVVLKRDEVVAFLTASEKEHAAAHLPGLGVFVRGRDETPRDEPQNGARQGFEQ